MTIKDFNAQDPKERRRLAERLADMRKNGKYLWTCGHTAGAVCGECYAELAQRANMLAESLERKDEVIAMQDKRVTDLVVLNMKLERALASSMKTVGSAEVAIMSLMEAKEKDSDT